MGILDSLFGKKQKNDEQANVPAQYVELTDLVLDWFKADNEKVVDFEEKFFEPVWEAILKQYKSDYQPNQFQFFPMYAAYYLIGRTSSDTKTVERLKSISNIITKNELPEWAVNDLFISIRNFKKDENALFFQPFEKGYEVISVYLNITGIPTHFHGSEYCIMNDFDFYSSLLSLIKIDKLPILTRLFQYNTSYDDYVPNVHRDELITFINKDVKEYHSELEPDIVINYLDLLNFRHTPLWRKESDKKKFDIKNMSAFTDYVTKALNKEERYISNMLYLMKHFEIPYKMNEALHEVMLLIIDNKKFNTVWINETFKAIDYKYIDILQKLLDNIKAELKYDDEPVLLYEKYVFDNVGYYKWTLKKNDLKFLEYFYNRIQNEKLRYLYLQRISAPKVVCEINRHIYHEHCTILENDKLQTTKKIIEELNYILPVTIKSTNTRDYSYDGELVTRACLVSGEDEFSITDATVEELNQFLADRNTGYQLVPVPLDIKNYSHYNDHKTFCLGALIVCSYEEYNYIQSQYDVTGLFRSVYSRISYSNKSAVPFETLKQQIHTPVNVGFEYEKDWLWFKNDYIDKLSSKDKWYRVMDVIIKCNGTKSLNKKWAAELTSLLNEFPAEQYFRELQSLLTGSLNQDFWYFDTYQKGLKGFMWSCMLLPTQISLNILRLIIEKTYTKVPGIGPRSAALGNYAINVLLETGKEEAFGLLNIMRNKTKYNRFALALDKAIDKFKETSNVPEQLLADKTIPTFDFDDSFERQIPLGEYKLHLYFHDSKLQKQWINNADKIQKSVPAGLKETYASQLKEINDEVKQINAVFTDLAQRIKTYWLYARNWSAADWTTYVLKHPLINQHIQQLIWTNKTSGIDFIVSGTETKTITGEAYTPEESDEIILWHPVLNTNENIIGWQEYMWKHKIVQKHRQAFREYYPFSEKETGMTESKRFAGHFLEVNKLMAIANNTGWLFTYVHEGNSWPRIYLKQPDLTFHLKCDYSRSEFAIPTQEIFVTQNKTTNIEYTQTFDKIPFSKVSPVTLSELCRDVDLFIAVTSVANNPDMAQRQQYESYYMQYEKNMFTENASVSIRHRIIEKLIPVMQLASTGFDGNFLLIDGHINSYKINLGSGFAQTKTGKHINLMSEIKDVKKKVTLPVEDDDTLYIILAKAILLGNDKDIKNPQILAMLQ